jgi:Cu/Zn superoxide dismutase
VSREWIDNVDADVLLRVQFGDLTDLATGQSAGPRFIGDGKNVHGCPPDDNRHAGDLVPPAIHS